MPIRINLLAEAQAAEEVRRKDPVKRGAKVALLLVMLVLVWSSSLYLKLINGNGRLSQLEGKLSSRTNDYVQILNDEKKLVASNLKLAALYNLATNRFLNASMLNALQRSSTDGVQLLRLHTEQTFIVVPGEPATKTDGRTIPGKPGNNTEKAVLVLEARDASPNPGGETINEFKNAIARNPYFLGQHVSTNDILLRNLSTPQVDPESGSPFVLFSLECRYPDKTHADQ